MPALLRFIWQRFKYTPEAVWLLRKAVPASLTVMGVSFCAADDKLPGYLWIPLGLLTCILTMHFVYLMLEARDRLARSPLEIIFDLANSNKHFWSIIPITDNNGNTIASQWEYRQVIRNKS